MIVYHNVQKCKDCLSININILIVLIFPDIVVVIICFPVWEEVRGTGPVISSSFGRGL